MSNTRHGGIPDGVYEQVVSEWLAEQLRTHASGEDRAIQRDKLSADLSVGHLARALHDAFILACDGIRGKKDAETVEQRLGLANELLARMLAAAPGAFRASEARLTSELLRAVASRRDLAPPTLPEAPASSLVRSELLVNGENRSVIGELLSEIDSADEIDLVCAFIKSSGLVKFREALRRHCQTRRRPMRVLTTTYMGATEAWAVAELRRLGATVRVSYDEDTTRLHAKAWLFRRHSGFDTAYVGSSNLSKAALTDGLEWNVRVTNRDTPQVIERFRAVFNSYWDDPESGFVSYEETDEPRLASALQRAGRPRSGDDEIRLSLELEPRPHQRTMLRELAEARAAGRMRNLVVAATGTGKTVVAALDFKRLHDAGEVKSLLFVAHREEILRQSRCLFELVAGIRGELYVGGQRPIEGRFVFASIQSLRNIISRSPPRPDAYDMVIVDEVHHAAADTYTRLLRHVQPKFLLGLSATPERADGLSLEEFFPGPYAAELRVWDAIERQILVPFNYFGLEAGPDLSDVRWVRGRYDREALSQRVLGASELWLEQVLKTLPRYVPDLSAMRALAFCVDIRHAQFVAERLNARGIFAEALTSESDDALRSSAVQRLQSNAPDRPRVLCTVDLFNEGVDIPKVDTLLLLRPTESATVFLQQLGRGLRRADTKDSLLVLDFIGKQYEKFRFDLRYQALTGLSRGDLERSLRSGFGRLPAGCTVQFEQQAAKHVLACIRRALPTSHRAQAEELRRLGPSLSLEAFLDETGLTLGDVYEGGQSWTGLRRAAGFDAPPSDKEENDALSELQRLLHADDEPRLHLWTSLARDPTVPLESEAERRLARMLFAILYGTAAGSDIESARTLLARQSLVRAELTQLLPLLTKRSVLLARAIPLAAEVPLVGHAHYLGEELIAAFDHRPTGRLFTPMSGVVRLPAHDLLLTTIDKEAKKNLPHLMYRDFALSPTEFHWQSQARTTIESEHGQRHVSPQAMGITPVLFVRETAKDDRGLGCAYRYLGPVEHVRHEGERPISIVWRLPVPMPAALVREARAVA